MLRHFGTANGLVNGRRAAGALLKLKRFGSHGAAIDRAGAEDL
jgi:hypothetical protein